MHEQGNAHVVSVPVNHDATSQPRPELVSAARAAVDIVRNGDLDAIRQAKHGDPGNPYSVAEVSDALGVSKSTIYKAVERGELAGMRFGGTRKGTIRIPHSAFVEWVAECMAAAVTRPGANAKRRSIRVEISDATPAGQVA